MWQPWHLRGAAQRPLGLQNLALADDRALDDPVARGDGPAAAVGGELDDEPGDSDQEQDQADGLDRDACDGGGDRQPQDEADGDQCDGRAYVGHGELLTFVSPSYPWRGARP